jgi:hypothetical protein
MALSSEELEDFHDRVKEVDSVLSKLKGAEVTRSELIEKLAAMAKDWLRFSPQVKTMGDAFLNSLDSYDVAMSGLLQATKQRTRASSYRTRLKPFLQGFLENVVVPLIRYEGSPAQVAGRKLEAVFTGVLEAEEYPYVEEAARCSSVHCHRAAIILFWAAAMARMHRSIQRLGFAAFNSAVSAAALKKGPPYSRITKGLAIQSLPELQRTRDFDILAVGLELWSLDLQAFDELDRLLGTRNSAAHPGMFQPLALDVQQFAGKLRQYVFDVIR